MNCPKCKTTVLELAQVAGVELDRCPTCRGIWSDRGELSALLELPADQWKRLARGKADDQRNRMAACCPRDGANLVRVASADNRSVVIDICLQCQGIWLDGGELAQLLPGS